MAENNLGRNITFPIYYDTVDNGTATQHETGLVIHKATVETSVMSLGDKITGDVYYANNSLQVTMQEYIVYNDVRYILVSPPTIIREGMVSENGELKGMTKYSFVFYHPMYVLSNFPFSDVAVSPDEKRYLSENKVFSWIGKPQDFIDKLNKNLEGTEWVVVKSSNFPQDTENELSDVLKFDNNTIADALKTGYETWGLPYVIDQIHQDEQGYGSEKKFKVIFGLPSNAIMDGQNEYVFRMGQGVGLKNNSRTPRNNKIVTRIAGYGSENNIPYGYPQIQWYGNQSWTNTKNNPNDPTAYPIYDGIVGGRYVKLIKHPFTRNHLMPSVYRQALFNKVSPYLSDGSTNSYYDPDIELVDYYDANTDSYPNQINLSSPSYEIHQFEDVKPELGEAEIVGVQPIKNDGTDADGWDDTMDDDGNYLQSYFKLTLPRLDFDMYACAAITEEMQINMRSGACIGCTFPVQVDWEDYKKNFYDDDGNFDPVIGQGHPRNASKYPDSSSGSITVIVQKEYSTFGVLMPNIYQKPASGDEFVILGISLPDTYVTNAEGRLDDEMRAYMLANNVHYYDYPLKFDEYFLATHTDILSQIRTNTQVKFQFANEDPMTLFVKQIVIKYGENTLPQYDITLTDSVEVVLNQIGKVADDVEKLSALVSVLRQSYNRNVWGEIAKKLSKTSNDTAQGEITFLQGLKIGSNGNNGIAPNGDATLNDVNVSGDLTITHVETPQEGEPIVKEYGITNDGDISGEGLEIGNFANSGLLGTGGAFKMVDGKSYLEADKLYVRMKAYFDTLEIRRYIHSGGNRVASAAGCKVSRVVGSSGGSFYRLCFKATDGDNTVTNDFTIGDFAYCHTTNLEGGELNQQNYWRLVMRYGSLNASRQIVSLNGEPVSGIEDTVVTEHFIDVANTTNLVDIGEEENYQGMMAGSTEPKAEDDVVQLGHAFDEDRQGAIIEAVTGATQAPTYRIYQGINSFNLENKCKVDMGYDLTTHRAYLNVFGNFYVGAEGNNPSTYIRYTQGQPPLLEIKAKIDATSGSPILNTINSKAQVYMNTVGTIGSVAYKAGDLWILPEAVGTFAAGTMLVAKNDKGASFNLNDWDAVEETEFNAYIAQIVGGDIVSSDPTDAQQAANKINAIKKALNDGTTTINGGLILTNLIALKNGTGGVTAGITGQSEENDIALWLGGQMDDWESLTPEQQAAAIRDNYAKSLFRFDGSGYLAGGNISWKDNGDTTVKGTVRADNLYHGVCFFHEETGADHYNAEQHVDMFSTPKHYINGVKHYSTGTCDVVFMIPFNSQNPWNKYGIDGTQVAWEHDGITADVNNEEHGWPLDARTLTLPSPEDFDGKTIEVFIYSTGDESQERIAEHKQQWPHDDGWGEEKQIKIRSLKIGSNGKPIIENGMPVQYPVVVAVGFNANTGMPITVQQGDNYVVSKDPSVGYLRFQATRCQNTNGQNIDPTTGQPVTKNEYAWIMSTGMGGVNITNIEGDVIYSEGAGKDWVNARLEGAINEYDEEISDPTQWDACLRLSAGINQCLTDSLFLQPNKAIKIKDGSQNGIDLLSFASASGNTPAKWVLGTGDNGIIRSGGELYRWVNNNTQYKIWDASNLTPSNYLLKTDISDWAKASNPPTLDDVADGNTRKLSNYLQLIGGTLKGTLTFATANGNSYGAIQTYKNGSDEYLHLWGNDGVLIDGLYTRENGSITEVASRNWVNSQGFLTSHQSLANYVTLDGTQTITGAKTFDNVLTVNGSNSAIFALEVAGAIRANTGIRIGASQNDALMMDTSSVVYSKAVQSGGVTTAITSTLATFGWDNTSASAQYGYLDFSHRPKVGGVNVALTSDISGYVPLNGNSTIKGNVKIKSQLDIVDSNGTSKIALFGNSGQIHATNVYIGGTATGNLAATRTWVGQQGYQANVIEGVTAFGTACPITNKIAEIPMASSDGSTFGVVAIGTGFTFDDNRLCVDTQNFVVANEFVNYIDGQTTLTKNAISSSDVITNSGMSYDSTTSPYKISGNSTNNGKLVARLRLSLNHGAIVRVTLTSYSEASYDFGAVGFIDKQTLSTGTVTATTIKNGTTPVLIKASGNGVSATGMFSAAAGNHTIEIGYFKDGSTSSFGDYITVGFEVVSYNMNDYWNAINGKVSKDGDSMSGNLTMIGGSFLFKATASGSTVGAIMPSTVTPQGYESAVGCITIGGAVNFDNDGAPPMVNGNYLATEQWANGKFLPLTGGMANYVNISDGHGAAIGGIYNANGVMTLGGESVAVNSDGSFTFNGSQVATQTWAENLYMKKSDKAGLFTQFANYDGAVQITIGGTQKSLTIAYANAAGSATRTMGFKGMYVTGSQIADANTMTVGGVEYALLSNYASTDLWANMPSGMSYGNVLQLTSASSLSGQLAWDVNDNSNTPTNRIWWRARNSTGWGNDWQQFVMYRNLGTGAVDTYAGTFAFGGNEALQAGYDYAGLQVGSDNDRWQITAIGSLRWRQNDNNDLASAWQSWRTILDTSNWSSYVMGFLPLTAGSGNALTGELFINKSATASATSDVALAIANNWAKTDIKDKSIGITIGASSDYYFTKIATVFESQNPDYLRPALAFYTMDSTAAAGTEIERMRIAANGNVGIGTNSPIYKLDVRGNVSIGNPGGFGKIGCQYSASNTDLYNYIALTSADSNGDIVYQAGGWTASDHVAHLFKVQGSSTALVIRNNGNVGIGTTTPAEKLDVVGSIHLSEDIILDNERIIYFKNHSGTACDALSHSYNSTEEIDILYIGFDFCKSSHSTKIYGNELTFFTGTKNDERMVITSDGNVGIGLGGSAPTYKLQVSGTTFLGGGVTLADTLKAHSVLPTATNLFDLGSSNMKWKNLYISGNVNIGNEMTISNTLNANTIISDDNIEAQSGIYSARDGYYFGSQDDNSPARLYVSGNHLYFDNGNGVEQLIK